MKPHNPLYPLFHPSPEHVFSRLSFGAMNLFVWIVCGICLVLALQWGTRPFAGFLVNERMVISDHGNVNWPGVKAGLRYPSDKIVKANDQPIHSMDDLQAVVDRVQVGDSIRYTIDRAGETMALALPVISFTWVDWFMTFGLTFFSGLAYLTLGFIVYILKPDSDMTWPFLFSGFFLGLYSISAFDVASTHWGMVRLNLLAFLFIPAAFLHLSLVFPERTTIIQRFPFLGFLPYVVSLCLAIPVEAYYPDPRHVAFARIGRMYAVLSAMVLIGVTLLSFFRSRSYLARQRAKIVLFGAAVAFPITAIGLLASINTWTIGGLAIQNNFLAIPVIIFPMAISYAIARHNLFDVDKFIKQAVGYGLTTLFVGMTYFGVQTIFRTLVLDPLFGEASAQIYPIVFAILIVFLFNPASRALQDLVDQLFFRKQFDYKAIVASVSDAFTSLLQKHAVVHKLLDTVENVLFVDMAGVFLIDQDGCLSLYRSHGAAQARSPEADDKALATEDPLVSLVTREKRLVTKYDLAEDSRFQSVREACEQRFAKLGSSLALPLMHENEVKGVLLLGYKQSGHFYTRDDIELLETLANQGAVAIENAKRADQMKEEEGVRTNLARYLSPQIVDQIIDKHVQVDLGGDRKVVTVLFSDIRNFTTITETRPPDQLVVILNEYFTEMADIIFSSRGSLDKYIGDAIVAVFGSLIPLQNPTLNATQAAIAMMERMKPLNEKWMTDYDFHMDIGIGINTGEVFLGNIGSPERMEFTVIGDAVNVASRFSGIAKPGQILVTKESRAFLNGTIPCQQLPSREIKGKSEKQEVFEVVL